MSLHLCGYGCAYTALSYEAMQKHYDRVHAPPARERGSVGESAPRSNEARLIAAYNRLQDFLTKYCNGHPDCEVPHSDLAELRVAAFATVAAPPASTSAPRLDEVRKLARELELAENSLTCLHCDGARGLAVQAAERRRGIARAALDAALVALTQGASKDTARLDWLEERLVRFRAEYGLRLRWFVHSDGQVQRVHERDPRSRETLRVAIDAASGTQADAPKGERADATGSEDVARVDVPIVADIRRVVREELWREPELPFGSTPVEIAALVQRERSRRRKGGRLGPNLNWDEFHRLVRAARRADAGRDTGSEDAKPLPRCEHGKALRDHGGERLEPPCGCRDTGVSAPPPSEEGTQR